MRTLGQLLVFGGILTGIASINMLMDPLPTWRKEPPPGVAASIAVPLALLVAGGLLIRWSKPKS